MSPPADVVAGVAVPEIRRGMAVPELRRGIIEEHDNTSWVSWVLVGEETLAVIRDLVLLYDIRQGKH